MENMKKLRKAKKLTQKDLGKLVGISEAQISLIENGKRFPSFETLLKIAEALDCESSDLLSARSSRPNVTNNFVTFPIIGEVAAGYDHYAAEDWTEGNIDIPQSWLKGRQQEDYFVLRVSGNSMYPMYQEGDIVLVLKQTTMNHSGEIGVVVYDDDKATIKRVEYVMGEDWMKLSPVNPQYPPIMIRDEKLEHCRVLGIPKMLIRSVQG